LSEYRPPDWLVETVDLDYRLNATRDAGTRDAQAQAQPVGRRAGPLVLDGDGLKLVATPWTGHARDDHYVATPDSLTIAQPPRRPFTLEIETLVDPSANTQLSGSTARATPIAPSARPKAFRRITYFPDRPT
jgi:aminopeptidase N